jgi:aspartate/methionine/tyrosine aminotransferase
MSVKLDRPGKNITKLHNDDVQDLFYRIKKLEAKGINIINFAFSVPGFNTPKVIQDTAQEAIRYHKNQLVPIEGITELRTEIRDYIDRTRGFRPDMGQIVVGSSVKIMLFTSLISILKQKDEVYIPNPGIPYYSRLIEFLGGKAKPLPSKKSKQFTIDFSKLESQLGKNSKAIILSTPNNPTGQLLSKQDVEKLAEIAQKKKLFIISDETYSQIIHNGRHITPSITDHANENTILLENLSYTFSIAGWGLGFSIIPKHLFSSYRTVITDMVLPVPNFIQYAGITAFRHAEKLVPEIVEKYNNCSKTMVNGLKALKGFKCELPSGGIHAFPEISGTGLDGQQMADHLLENVGIAVLSGNVFGSHGNKHIRLSFANSTEYINEGLIRLEESF